MTKQCEICAKKKIIVGRRIKLRGKFNVTTTRNQRPNLQWAILPSGKKVLACAKCIKALSKKK